MKRVKPSEAFWQFLPEGLDELFEMVKFEKTDQSYDIWLDEKKQLSDEGSHGDGCQFQSDEEHEEVTGPNHEIHSEECEERKEVELALLHEVFRA